MVFFSLQKHVSLIMSHLFIYVFISNSLGDWPKKTLVQFMSENVLPMLSSSGFIVLWLVFKSLSHFEFIFVHDIKLYSNLIDLEAAVQLSQHHMLKRLFFSHFIFLPLLLKISGLLVCLYLGSPLCSISPHLFFYQYCIIFITETL